ncbi:MAG: metalloregulator ArsR/SmtB family transcription factor [Candidatus Sericytochromatia bacterium]
MSNELEIKEMAVLLKALGEPSRLKIFEYLASCCDSFALDDENNIRNVCGITVGDICCTITGENNITSTMSHHLKELRYAGLINVERKGKNMLYSINKEKVSQLSKFLSKIISPCCGGIKK